MLRIDSDRLLADLEDLGRIGATAEGGVTRRAFSEADVAGRKWFEGRVKAAGLELREDGAGNLSAVLRSRDPGARILLLGSHLDTVPNGGRYDGALGVLAALEALRRVQEQELALPVHLEAISFTDEEGSLLGEFGSLAVAGRLDEEALGRARGGAEALSSGMARLGISLETARCARRTPRDLAGYLELHIEQGTRLEEAGLDIGAVTAIVGIRSARLFFRGLAGHAGTLPMEGRRDALLGAAEFVKAAHEVVVGSFSPGVVNCGELKVRPGAFNIVPGEAVLALEFRHESEEQLDLMATTLYGLAREISRRRNLKLDIEPAGTCPAAPSAEVAVRAIEDAADSLGLSHQRLLSFAGHDAQVMSTVTPSAMIFVPCKDGISHNPREFCRPADVVNGANVLLRAALELAAVRVASGRPASGMTAPGMNPRAGCEPA